MSYQLDERYKNDLVRGMAYQDFIAGLLYKHGLPIVNFSTKKYQLEIGENINGFEIKYDEKYEKTGNLFIEFSERPTVKQEFGQGGIFRNDNTWLYIIGNYKTVFIFGLKHLRVLYRSKKYREVEIPTARGYLLPSNDAYACALKTIEV